LIKRTSLLAVTVLWGMAIAFPVHGLQLIRIPIGHVQIPIYYPLIVGISVILTVATFFKNRPSTPLQIAMWAFVMIGFPAILWLESWAWPVRQWLSFCIRGLVVGAAISCIVDSEAVTESLLRAIYIVVVAACLFGYFEMFAGRNPMIDALANYQIADATLQPTTNTTFFRRPSDYAQSHRPTGTQGNRIPYTACLVPFIPIALWKAQAHRASRAVHVVASAALGTLVIWSQVRSSWIALLVSLAVYAILITRRHPQFRLRIAIGLGLIVALNFAVPSIRHSVLERAQTFNLKNKDIAHRLGSLPVLSALHDRWLFGVGYGRYGEVYRPFYTGPYGQLATPDNQFFRWLIETGVFGFVALMTLLIAIAYRSWRGLRTLDQSHGYTMYAACLAAWFAILVTFAFFDGFYWLAPNLTFWCLSGLLIARFGEHK
jgi:hypothetical protein